MPEPQADPNFPLTRRVALHALAAGVVITALKLGVFAMTNSVAVLSDALESVINIAAAGVMLYSLWLANRPADREHPYGHGKVEVMAVGLEGWLILFAGLSIAVEAVRRLIAGTPPERLDLGVALLAGIGGLSAMLAWYVWSRGRRYDSAPLKADGRHLMTDVVSTLGVVLGLLLVRTTGKVWLDPLVAIVVAGLILAASWKLLWQSVHGLMDRTDPADNRAIAAVLDAELAAGRIHGYHKVRHRHTGRFHWVDMHLQVDGGMTVTDGHALASAIERRVEEALGDANATAHLEPWNPDYRPEPEKIAPGAIASDPNHTRRPDDAGPEPGSEPKA